MSLAKQYSQKLDCVATCWRRADSLFGNSKKATVVAFLLFPVKLHRLVMDNDTL